MAAPAIASRAISVVVAVTFTAGCATNPLPRWQAPPAHEAREHSMAYARAYADAARTAYRSALDREVGASRDVGTTLIGLGALAAGMAAFKAHRDAITGAALLGGSTLAMGNWHINKQRQLVYVAALEAINCAVKAVVPFDMSATDQTSLREALNNLEAQIAATTDAIGVVEAEKNRLVATDSAVAAAEGAVATANAAVTAARETLVSGRKAAANVRAAGAQLVIAIDGIGAAVDKAVLDTLPDINSVKTVIAGLGALAGSIAPGAGVDTRLATALGSFAAQSRGEGGATTLEVRTPISNALETLGQQLRKLLDAVAVVRGFTSGLGAEITGLTECGVQISFPLVATPNAVELTAGTASTHTVVLGGGTAPFSVRRQGSDVAGLTIVTPMAFDRAIHIATTTQLAGSSGTLLVLDASNPPKTISIALTIKTAGATPPGGGSSSSTPPDPDPLVERIKALTEPFTVEGVAITMTKSGVALVNGKINVPVTCAPATAPPLAQESVVNGLKAAKVDGIAIGSGASIPAGKIVITGPCVIAAAAQSRTFKVAVAPSETVRAQQRGLCLAGRDVDGLRGPVTQEALEKWRAKAKSAAERGSAMTPAEEKELTDPGAAKKWCAAG